MVHGLRGGALAELRQMSLLAAWPLARGAFWMPAGATPANALEGLARRIFDFHVAEAPRPINPESSGCEWWANVTRSDLLESAQTGDIGFHFDKDERAYEKLGLVVHPLLSTVTYLTDDGAPTVVLPDVVLDGKGAGGSYQRCNAPPLPSRSDALLVPPRVGRHLSFDGRWLHGAPACLRPAPAAKPYERITFLVNVWINHRPAGSERFGSCLPTLPTHMAVLASDALSLRHVAARRMAASRSAPVTTLQGRTAESAGSRPHACQRFALEHTSEAHELVLPQPPRIGYLLARGDVVRVAGGVDIASRSRKRRRDEGRRRGEPSC